ncbi:two component transcriptional regulator, LuxR family [Alteromonadaceae bacterium 2753L.S.0a.02]|nr:two component transcriptional regulator, LuxR family [Alteromonadaceae bacterium 2753L.S.0a.02]
MMAALTPSTSTGSLILVVDDSPETVGMLNDTLEAAGMTTLVALEGGQALSIARRMMPDIILLDAMMPVMDGFEVCRQLKADPELRSIPVIFMTGLKDTESVVRGFEVGGVDYVTKPIVNNELIARMRVHLANARVTLSAQTALDTAGQYMFAVNNAGEVIWTTPQVNQLLEAANEGEWMQMQLQYEIKHWLAHSPNIGMGVNLKSPKRSLRLEYLGNSAPNEILIRLIDNDKPDESVMLREHLPLTTRESEVLLWLARGKTNREIGQILGTSPRTVNKHLEQVYKKLGVENRTAAAGRALQVLG